MNINYKDMKNEETMNNIVSYYFADINLISMGQDRLLLK